MNYDKIIEMAGAMEALASAAGYAGENFLNFFKNFGNELLKIPYGKKICHQRRKVFDKLPEKEIYFPLLPHGYISGIPPPRRKDK